MGRFFAFAILGIALVLSGCAAPKVIKYEGPQVTRILVFKESRKMYLMHHGDALRAFDFELGFDPRGHKRIEGDGRTPEGHYYIDRRNPDSDFHLSLGISYPNAFDIEVARRLGQSPGGDIFIHGTPKLFGNNDDWTWGCIAVTNEEIEQIYAMVPTGTPITIYP